LLVGRDCGIMFCIRFGGQILEEVRWKRILYNCGCYGQQERFLFKALEGGPRKRQNYSNPKRALRETDGEVL
jgi:hypothetical protein